MIRLSQVLNAWGTPDFETVLKQEIAQLDTAQLPLQQGLINGNYVADTPLTVVINRIAETDHAILVTAGIFYEGLLGGCSCAGDPTTASKSSEYCEVRLDINKTTAETTVALVTE